MSCVVIDMELTDINVIKELGVFIDGKVQAYYFCPPKKYKPTKKRFGAQETCTGLCLTIDVWITVSFQRFFLEL